MPKEKPWKFQAYEGSAEDIEFKLTPQSLELFEQGLPFQGYIGLLELESGKVHLVPSFNYPREFREEYKFKDENGVIQDNKEAYHSWANDIDFMQNKKGEFFHATSDSGKRRNNYYVTTFDPLGSNTGKAHGKSVSFTNTSQIAGAKGLVVGFGVWKGQGTVINEFRDRSLSQNRHAIQFSNEFTKDLKNKLSDLSDTKQLQILELQRERSLPQELSTRLLNYLLENLPCEENMSRTLLSDGRAFDIPNPFIQAVIEGKKEEVKAFLEAGMHVNEIGTSNRETALHAAARIERKNVDNIAILADLLSHPEIKLDILSAKGNLFCDYLRPNESKSIIDELIKRGHPKQARELVLFLLKNGGEELDALLDQKYLYKLFLKLKNKYADEPNTILLTKVIKNRQELSNYEYSYQKSILSLHDIASMDSSDNSKIPKLTELLSQSYVLNDNDNKLFYRKLSSEEISNILKGMLEMGNEVQAAKFARWLSQKGDFKLISSIDSKMLFTLYALAIEHSLDDSHRLLFRFSEDCNKPSKEEPLYNELIFAKCCLDEDFAKENMHKVDVSALSQSLLLAGLKKSMSNYNIKVCKEILKEVEFNDKNAWIKILNSVPDKRALKVSVRAREYYKNFREELRERAKELESDLMEIMDHLKDDLKNATDNDYSEDIAEIKTAVSVFSHPYFHVKHEEQKPFPDVKKHFEKIHSLNEALSIKCAEKRQARDRIDQGKVPSQIGTAPKKN